MSERVFAVIDSNGDVTNTIVADDAFVTRYRGMWPDVSEVTGSAVGIGWKRRAGSAQFDDLREKPSPVTPDPPRGGKP